MKKVSLILSLILFTVLTSQAQVRFGAKIGANIANMSISQGGLNVTPSSIFGFHIGGLLEYDVNDKVAIQPNLLYSQKGYSSTISGISAGLKLNYLELPINVLYRANEKLFLGGGPSFAYALSGKEKITMNGTSIEADAEFGNNDGYNRFDAGLNLIVGYEVAPSYVISANYTFGLTSTFYDTSFSGQNTVLGLSLTKFFGEK